MGQGYVGLPVAMRAVAQGYSVVGFDVDEVRVKRLNAGESYVEDITDEVLQSALASGRYRASTRERDCAGFDVAVITVPTPLRDGVPDLSYIEASARTLGRYLRPGATVLCIERRSAGFRLLLALGHVDLDHRNGVLPYRGCPRRENRTGGMPRLVFPFARH